MFSHSPQHNITYSITLRKKEVIGHFMCTHFTLFYVSFAQQSKCVLWIFSCLSFACFTGALWLVQFLLVAFIWQWFWLPGGTCWIKIVNCSCYPRMRAKNFSCIYFPLLFGFQLENGIVISCFVESEMNLSHEHIICSFSHLIFLCANFCLTFMHGMELYPSFCTFFCTHNLSGVFTLSSCNDRKGKVDICRAAVIRFLVFFFIKSQFWWI